MTDGLYELPSDWRWAKIGDLFDLQQGVSMSPARRAGRAPMPFLRTSNVYWGYLDLSSVDKMDFTEEEVEKLSLRSGDLLICEGGDVGRTAMWQGELEVCLYQNHIHRLRRKGEDIEPVFYMYWMQTAYRVHRAYAGEASRTAIPNLSGRRLKAFVVPLPPVEEQRQIVAKIEALFDRIREVQRLRAAADEQTDVLIESLHPTDI